MLGKNSVLKSLASRRQALVAESDRNRTELAHEMRRLKQAAADVISPVRKTGHFISLGAKAAGVVFTLRKVWTRAHAENGNKHWAGTLLRAARAGISLWPAFRSRAR
jgi:hypothetical protein